MILTSALCKVNHAVTYNISVVTLHKVSYCRHCIISPTKFVYHLCHCLVLPHYMSDYCIVLICQCYDLFFEINLVAEYHVHTDIRQLEQA